jgi:hypothetical protein
MIGSRLFPVNWAVVVVRLISVSSFRALLTTRGARVICFGWDFGWLVVGVRFARG